jgi:UDP-glucose 4-epimerase
MDMYEVFADNEFDGVLHLAALVSVPESFENPEDNAKINLYATDTIARLCVYFEVPRMVFASSAAVYAGVENVGIYGESKVFPASPYGFAKLSSEIMLRGYSITHDLNTVSFRYFNVYGPRQRSDSPYSGVLAIFTDKFKRGEPIIVYGDGRQVRDFISVKDVARFNIHALTAGNIPSAVYNACTGIQTSLNDIIERLQELYPDAPEPRYEKPRKGDPVFSLGDPSMLRKTTGLEAIIPFSMGLTALVQDS